MGYEIDFLAVGDKQKSGDAIVLRYGDLQGGREDQTVVVVDGGFKDSGKSLVEFIRSTYNTDRVDVVVLTHPDADHASGLTVVLEELQVDQLWMHQPWDHTDDIARMFHDGRVTDNSVREKLQRSLENARELERLAKTMGIPIVEPFAGLTAPRGGLVVLGPTIDFYEDLLPHFRSTPEPVREDARLLEALLRKGRDVIQRVAEAWNVETLDDTSDTSAENQTSVVLLLNHGDEHHALLTGDAGIEAISAAMDYYDENFSGPPKGAFKFVQVPHHGSKRNVGPTILDRVLGKKLASSGDDDRGTAFVSVAKEGAPKHPAKKVTNAFRRRGYPVHPTCGANKRHHVGGSVRSGYSPCTPLPMYGEVED